MDTKKKIVIVEDDMVKRDDVTWYLDRKNIEYVHFEFINPALRYIIDNKDDIIGIILDLGLQSAPGIFDRTQYRGLEVLNEMERKKINIPTLINSSTEVKSTKQYPCIYAQRINTLGNYDLLEEFVTSLT